MGFLDNSGDIILDAVLTDTGRFRLAKGDGSFKIAKFALSDDEIDYGLYNKSHASGSAYFDLNILQTPVMEAFTNNTSLMKSKLLSIPRNNLLYLPTIKLNREAGPTWYAGSSLNNIFIVAVDKTTEDTFAASTESGILMGLRLTDPPGRSILVEQGLDTTEIPAALALDPELVETRYTIKIDNRLGKISSPVDPAVIATPSFIDDDNIAQYFFSLGTTPQYVASSWTGKTEENTSLSVIRGPRGTRVQFYIAASIELATSTYLFTTLGSTATIESQSMRFIDTIVRIEGASTGASVDIPVRFAKQV